MPYIVKKLASENIEFGNQKTLILDIEKTAEITKELELTNELGTGITNKEVIEIKNSLGDLSYFKDIEFKEDSKWLIIVKQIENIEEFYNIVWERTVLELMFMSQYFITLISNPQSFEQVLIGGTEFEPWFLNNVKYNMLEKIKAFYLKTVAIYANKITLDIYEADVELKVKEIVNEIEQNHLQQVRDLLETTWNNTMIQYIDWKENQDKKRKSILFD